jgi:alkanesulfonate monooxygenase SsuD/methylene tetrahydromethanopterin reductase-like flavin-dependent oxidoreductase (luciferase family)
MMARERSTESTTSAGGDRLRRGLYLAPFDELATRASYSSWRSPPRNMDGTAFFVWDHIVRGAPVRAVADPWVVLSAVAAHTERLRWGPLVTPLTRRRVHKVARETATLDPLSRGRLVLGVGLGSNSGGELERFAEIIDPHERAQRLDHGLGQLSEFWSGEFERRPVQRPRVPVWVAARWPNRRPLRRAARWDGIFPIELPSPDELAELAAAIVKLRDGDQHPFEVVIDLDPSTDPDPWRHPGAIWILTDFGPQPRPARVRDVIEHALQ